MTFSELKLPKHLLSAINDLGLTNPTPIQEETFSVILSGRDVVGIAQTGTGKTLAYLLPLLRDLTYSEQLNPRILILVPTRELVIQVVKTITYFTTYFNFRVIGVYGGVNIQTQKIALTHGADIIVGTPGRLYDLAACRSVGLKDIKKLVIDEVDVMLDQGFRHQLENIFDLMPKKRQNIMFSATMTEEVDGLINDFFSFPERISIAVSGTRLMNIEQCCFPVPNFHTKANLLIHLLSNRQEFKKVLVFVSSKKHADRLLVLLESSYRLESGVIHSNKTQNHRINAVNNFDAGIFRVLVATDVIARGIDMEKVSHVVSFDTSRFPENYMHRIGRTGRAEETGKSILFYAPYEEEFKIGIEKLMNYTIPEIEFPDEVKYSAQLIDEEKPTDQEIVTHHIKKGSEDKAFHDKKKENKKVNLGGSYHRKIKEKYKKPQTRGDKIFNLRNKKK